MYSLKMKLILFQVILLIAFKIATNFVYHLLVMHLLGVKTFYLEVLPPSPTALF